MLSGGFMNLKAMNASTSTREPLVEKTTVKSQCFKKGDAAAVFWDLGSAQDVGKVTATPSSGVARIKVYLTSLGPEEPLSPTSLCGVITMADKTACRQLPWSFQVLRWSAAPRARDAIWPWSPLWRAAASSDPANSPGA